MLVNIDDRKLKDISKGVIIYTKEKGFELVDLSDFFASYEERVNKLLNRVIIAENKIETYDNLHIERTIREYTQKVDNDVVKDRLVNYMAFELLNDDINYNGKDFPEDYENCQKYIINGMVGDMPMSLQKYVAIVKGGKVND